jgi:DNA-binding NarL/FixJ family response regulator
VIRVFVADDHQIVREGLLRVLEGHPDMVVAGEAQDGEELLRKLQGDPFDVLILDISMPGMGFLRIMEEIRTGHPHLPVLVVSMHPEETWALQSFRAGAAGYLTKAHSSEELPDAIRKVASGGRFVTPTLAERMAANLGPESQRPPHETLSEREFQVLCLLGEGKMVKTVARELGLSPKTVSTYRARIIEKLDLATTHDLVRYVADNGLTS